MLSTKGCKMNQKFSIDDYDLIIFDMDGVILNIFDAIKQAIEDSVKKYNLNVIIDDVLGELALLIEKLQTIPIPKIILNTKELIRVSFLQDETVIKILRIAAYMYSQFKIYKENSQIYPFSDKIIKFLAAKGKKIAMLSNNLRSSVEESLTKFGLKQYFTEILGANDTDKLKPEPDGLFKIMKDQSINPKRTLFIGDMKTDIQAGKAAGIKTLCVASGLNKKEELIMEKPDYIVDDMVGLARMIGVVV